jgi:hypothetical protein
MPNTKVWAVYLGKQRVGTLMAHTKETAEKLAVILYTTGSGESPEVRFLREDDEMEKRQRW